MSGATWFEQELRGRFERHQQDRTGFPLSIKLRAVSGCFDCGGCNPHMQDFLDRLDRDSRHNDDYQFGRHESGPEWIIYVAAGTVILTFAKSVIDLVTAVIKARSDGQKKGDKDRNGIELIVRGFDQHGKLFEEKVLKLDAGDTPTEASIKKALAEGITKYLPPPAPTPAVVKKVGPKKTTNKRKRK